MSRQTVKFKVVVEPLFLELVRNDITFFFEYKPFLNRACIFTFQGENVEKASQMFSKPDEYLADYKILKEGKVSRLKILL